MDIETLRKNESHPMPQTAVVLGEVMEERQRQDAKWGEQNHAPFAYLAILGEEVGESNKAALETHFAYPGADRDYSEYRKELIQVAAVAVAAIECLDRGVWKTTEQQLLQDAERAIKV